MREQPTVLRYQWPSMLDGAGIDEAVCWVARKGRGEGCGDMPDRGGDSDRAYLGGQPSQP